MALGEAAYGVRMSGKGTYALEWCRSGGSMDGKGGIPRLVYGDSWVIPEVDDPEELADIVRRLVSIDR